MSEEYFEEADAGASLIAVLAPEPELVTEARQILHFALLASVMVLATIAQR